MRRRDFVFLICAATIAPRTLFARAISEQFRVGWFAFPKKDTPLAVRRVGQVLAGLGEFGYTEGQNLEMLYRFADFDADRVPQLALELAQLKPDVIVAPATLDAVAIKKATETIPIVVAALADPVELGLIKSYARPGEKRNGDNALRGRSANEAA